MALGKDDEMAWLGVLKVLLSLSNTLMTYLHDKQLLDAGMAQQLSADLRGTLDAIQKAHDARANVRDDADSVRNDPDNIDPHNTEKPVVP